MTRTNLITSIAVVALAAATPAFAKPGGGHGHGNAGAGAAIGTTVRDTARIQSQGAINANERATIRANQNSAIGATADSQPVTGTRIKSDNRAGADASANTRANTRADARAGLGGSAAAGAKLTGVTNGMTVVDGSGATVGTVTGIRTTGNGSARAVQVTLSNGQVITLDSRSLTLSDGVLTASSLTTNVNSQGAANASINGLVNASPNSALATAGVTTLTGLTTGLTVNNSAGAGIGTVSRVLTNRAGAVVGVEVSLSGGGTVTLPATSLTMDGSTVVTTATQ